MPRTFNVAAAVTVVLLLVGGVYSSSLLAQEEGAGPAEKPTPKAGDKPADKAPEPELDFKYIPQSVQMNSYVSFDQNGRMAGRSGNLNVTFRIVPGGTLTPLTIRNLQITKAVTDTGENLTPSGGMGEQRFHDWAQPGMQRGELNLNMGFTSPLRQAGRFTEIVGSFEVVCSKGQLQEAVLKPVSGIIDKRVRFKGTKLGWISFSRANNGAQPLIRVDYDNDMRDMLQMVQFNDETGLPIGINGWGGGGGGNGSEYRQFNINLPDKGSIVLRLYSETQVKTVPFRIVDIPIGPQDRGASPADVVIETHTAPADGSSNVKLPRLQPMIMDMEGD